MNYNQRTAMNSLLPRTLALVTMLSLSMGSLEAQENLQTKLRGLDADWMVGEWTGTNSQGVAIELEYEWELNGCSLEIELEIADDAYKGVIFHHPAKDEISETGVNDNGGLTRAVWEVKDAVLTSRRTTIRPSGETIRIAVVSRLSDDRTMRATVHPLSQEGEVGEAVIDTVTLTRVNKETPGD